MPKLSLHSDSSAQYIKQFHVCKTLWAMICMSVAANLVNESFMWLNYEAYIYSKKELTFASETCRAWSGRVAISGVSSLMFHSDRQAVSPWSSLFTSTLMDVSHLAPSGVLVPNIQTTDSTAEEKKKEEKKKDIHERIPKWLQAIKVTLLPSRGVDLLNHPNTENWTHLHWLHISSSPEPCTIVLALGTNPLLWFQCLECNSAQHMNYWRSSCCKWEKKIMTTRQKCMDYKKKKLQRLQF